MIRAAVVLTLYALTFWLYLFVVCVAPAEALLSPVAYSRVVAQAEWIAYQAAQKAATVAAVSAAAQVASPASIAIRAIAGPVGWAALGVTAGIALYQTFYDGTSMAAVKEAARPVGAASVGLYAVTNLVQGTPGSCGLHPTTNAQLCNGTQNQSAWFSPAPSTLPSGWTYTDANPSCIPSGNCTTWLLVHLTGGANAGVQQPGPDPALAQVVAYLTGLAANAANSIESHGKPLGMQATPDTGATTNMVPVSPAQMPTTVKPTSEVGPTDIVVGNNVPPPANQQQTTPTSQQSTTTTTTVNNPDGSKTETKTTTASSSCTTAAGHEQRTLGTILAAHQATWNSTGIVGAVNLLKTLTWPSTLPVLTLPTHAFGTLTVDFNDWSWFFTALRTLVIAGATLAAYRIIFVGGT